ncbi:MAG: glycosyltransferase family 39 protein [Candidatus Eisenbacteria bacterium]|nr:glycosyltransferase family 39 protein [Candidatus Eisenbacteria bacterium]
MTTLLLPIGALLVLAGTLLLRQPPAIAVAALLLAAVSFAPIPSGLLSAAEREGARIERRFPLLLGLLTAALVGFYVWLWGFHAHGFQPVVHDEFAYLFQAKTFLAGRLFFPSPPEPLFFDAFHILADPVYASKYPPGHALLLLPGVALGVPWLMPILATGLSLPLIGVLARPHLGAAGSLLLVLLFGLAPAGVQTATTYLSQTSYLLSLLLFVFFLARSVRSGGRASPLLAGLFLGFAFLVRHWNAVVLGAFAFACLLLSREARASFRKPARTLLLLLLPLALAAVSVLAYNRALTGSAFTTPWELYAERSQPEDRFGFYKGEPIEERAVAAGKRIYNERVLYPNRTRYTPGLAVRSLLTLRIPMSAWEALPPVGFLFLAPFLLALRGARRAAARAALSFSLLLHAAYLLYWFPWGPYYHEITPLLLALPLLGAREAMGRAARERRPGVFLSAILLLSLTLGAAFARLPFQVEFRREKAAVHARFERLVLRRTPPGSILFLRYGRGHNPDLDLVNNEPDLQRAARVYVHDLGEARNRAFRETHFPDREPFHFDEDRRTVVPGYAAPQ